MTMTTRYPINLGVAEYTRAWFAEIVIPECEIGPDGSLVDASTDIYVGDLASTPGCPLPGEASLAHNLAGRILWGLGEGAQGWTIARVWPAGGYQDEPF